MTTAQVAQQPARSFAAAAPSSTKPMPATSEVAAEALASSSALFAEHSRSEWELLLTALTVVGEESAENGKEAGEGNASSSTGSGGVSGSQPSSVSATSASAATPSFPSLASAVARGDYSLAFSTPEARRILHVGEDAEDDDEEDDEDEAARRYWSSVADACCAAPPPSSSASLERLALGASALLAFVQAAFTGPELELGGTPRELSAERREGGGKEEEEETETSRHPPSSLPPGGLPLSPLDAAALEASGANGEEVDSRVRGGQFLALAVAALLAPLGLSDGGGAASSSASSSSSPTSSSSLASALSRLPPTWSLWALRAACARQRVLGAPAAVTRDALDLLAPFAAAAVAAAAARGGAASSSPASSPPPLSAAQARLAAAGCALEAAACRLELRDAGGSGSAGSGSGSNESDPSANNNLAGAAFLREAAGTLGVRVAVTGALGVRTIHQLEARAQLVVRVTRDDEEETDDFVTVAGGDDVSSLFALGDEVGGEESAAASSEKGGDKVPPPKGGLSGLAAERSEVLTAPRLQGGGGGRGRGDNDTAATAAAAAASASPPPPPPPPPLALAPLTPPVQALLLLHASAVRRGTADDGLRAWRAAPFVEALSSSGGEGEGEGGEEEKAAASSFPPLSRSRWAVAACAALARARHELSRPRTRERALLAFERLASAQGERVGEEEGKHISSPSSAAARRRVPLALATPLPPSHRASKEAADALLSAGLVAEALDVYERVEAWEASALCHRLLGHAERARATLEARVREATAASASSSKKGNKKASSSLLLPALLCSLGDVTGDARRYEEAWERSRGRCARAQRALARAASARRDWAAAAAAWDLALALNPIHGEGWFARGYCALKLSDDASAALAFSRAAAEEPENGEAWNNLAAVHLRAERWHPAFSALSQAVKLKKGSWQTWHNYAQAALAVGEGAAAARGVAAVVELTDGQGLVGDGGALLLELARFAADASSSSKAAVVETTTQETQEVPGSGEERQVSGGEAAAGEGLISRLTLDDDFDGDGDEEAGNGDENPAAPALLSSRGLASLRAAVGRALRLAAASPACSSQAATWHALAIFHDSEPEAAAPTAPGGDDENSQQQQHKELLDGSRAAAREARLKRVAVLSGGTAWRSDAGKFDEFASAASDLGRAEARAAAEKRSEKAAAAAGAGGGQRELASARMLLKGVVATGRDRFAEAPAFAEAAEALEEVEKELRLIVEKRDAV